MTAGAFPPNEHDPEQRCRQQVKSSSPQLEPLKSRHLFLKGPWARSTASRTYLRNKLGLMNLLGRAAARAVHTAGHGAHKLLCRLPKPCEIEFIH